METIEVPKIMFSKIIGDMEVLLDDVESALDAKVLKRICQVEQKEVLGVSEEELDAYLQKRGVSIGGMDH